MSSGWGESLPERMVRAVEAVRERLNRATRALETAGVNHAVIGGHAVAAWVSRVDPGAVRNTPDVDLLIRRGALGAVTAALESVGFVPRVDLGQWQFLDGPTGRAREAVHVVFAGEQVRAEHTEPTPDVAESERLGPYRVLALPALVRMKLTSYRIKDKMHLLDLIDVGLVDASWVGRFSPELGARLQELIDNLEA